MRITEIRERRVPLRGNIANALVNFSEHDVSLVGLVSNVVRDGRPVVGVAFNSIGRFAQSGILRDRLIPRVLAAPPEQLTDERGEIDPARVAAAAMRNEKPGGHGDRAGAVAALELAAWDLRAKLRGEPAYAVIADAFAREPAGAIDVYAAGGYYYDDDSVERLTAELRAYEARGFSTFKIKIGGADASTDLRRIEAALSVAGSGAHLCVDANGRFDGATARAFGARIAAYALRWYEEPVDPLAFADLRELAAVYDGPIATGENLFSAADTANVVAFGGLRPDRDVLQMDAGLSYGITEYGRILQLLEAAGFRRAQAVPHGGHLINLHITMALGLGGCEVYAGVFEPFGGFSDRCRIEDGTASASDAPGFGLEEHARLRPYIADLLG